MQTAVKNRLAQDCACLDLFKMRKSNFNNVSGTLAYVQYIGARIAPADLTVFIGFRVIEGALPAYYEIRSIRNLVGVTCNVTLAPLLLREITGSTTLRPRRAHCLHSLWAAGERPQSERPSDNIALAIRLQRTRYLSHGEDVSKLQPPGSPSPSSAYSFSSPLVGFFFSFHSRFLFNTHPGDVFLHPHDLFRLHRAGAGFCDQCDRCPGRQRRLASRGARRESPQPGVCHIYGQVRVCRCAAPGFPARRECFSPTRGLFRCSFTL